MAFSFKLQLTLAAGRRLALGSCGRRCGTVTRRSVCQLPGDGTPGLTASGGWCPGGRQVPGEHGSEMPGYRKDQGEVSAVDVGSE